MNASVLGNRAAVPSRGAGPVVVLRTWLRRRRERLDLEQLDERALRDIGLTRAQALAESGKPFWQA